MKQLYIKKIVVTAVLMVFATLTARAGDMDVATDGYLQVFLIGDFNSWRIPSKNELNGAIEMPLEAEDLPQETLGGGGAYTTSYNFDEGNHNFAFYIKDVRLYPSQKTTESYVGGSGQPFMLFKNIDHNNAPTFEEGKMEFKDDLNSINKFQLVNWKGGNVELMLLYNVLGYRIFSDEAPLATQEEIDKAAGVDKVEASESVTEFYTLQGNKVENPESGIFIRKCNGKTSKVVIK